MEIPQTGTPSHLHVVYFTPSNYLRYVTDRLPLSDRSADGSSRCVAADFRPGRHPAGRLSPSRFPPIRLRHHIHFPPPPVPSNNLLIHSDLRPYETHSGISWRDKSRHGGAARRGRRARSRRRKTSPRRPAEVAPRHLHTGSRPTRNERWRRPGPPRDRLGRAGISGHRGRSAWQAAAAAAGPEQLMAQGRVSQSVARPGTEREHLCRARTAGGPPRGWHRHHDQLEQINPGWQISPIKVAIN